MSDYFRPIPLSRAQAAPDALCLAGGWTFFSEVEMLRRGQPPRRLPAADLPADWRSRLTMPRPDLLGVPMTRPGLMGIVNVTPDSFSDGGLWDDPDSAIAHGRDLLGQGADYLDVGGESTRPGATEVPIDEETGRVVPVISALASAGAVSVDTRKALVAAASVAAGAGLVNDVSGFDFDPDMAAQVAADGASVCLMHAQGLPETMQDDPRYDDVVLDVYDALAARIDRAQKAGIPLSRICVDPGIGFGKTLSHNLTILRRISLYHGLGCPVLLGVSRKRFIGTIGNAESPEGRDAGTLAVTLAAVAQGVQIHRVHNIEAVAQGIALWMAAAEE